MGQLSKGKPMSWKDALKHHAYIKKHGIIQFINLFHAYKDRENDKFFWGDEVCFGDCEFEIESTSILQHSRSIPKLTGRKHARKTEDRDECQNLQTLSSWC